MDTVKKSLKKSISWRIIATITAFCTTYYFTRDLTIAAEVATAEFFIKLVGYYFHERFWAGK
jgi:uncharacterized membrane protein